MFSEYSPIPGLDITRAGPGDREGVESLLETTIKEIAAAEPAHREACSAYNILGESTRELQDKLADAKAQLQATYRALDEAIDNPAADIQGLALQRHPLECIVSFLQDSLDRAYLIRQPTGLEHELETAVRLRRLEAVEAALHACLSHIDTQERLEKAGIFETEKRLCVVGERTTNLREAAKEAHRQAMLAEAALNEERARQLTQKQQRAAVGLVTRAETVFAVPAFQGDAVT